MQLVWMKARGRAGFNQKLKYARKTFEYAEIAVQRGEAALERLREPGAMASPRDVARAVSKLAMLCKQHKEAQEAFAQLELEGIKRKEKKNSGGEPQPQHNAVGQTCDR
jgi:hypothetical protein